MADTHAKPYCFEHEKHSGVDHVLEPWCMIGYEFNDVNTERDSNKKLMDDATVEIYNQKDEITKLRIKINELNNRIRELGG